MVGTSSSDREREHGPRHDDASFPSRHGRRSVLVPLPPVAEDPDHAAEAALPMARTVAARLGVPMTLLSVVSAAPIFNPLTQMAMPAPVAGVAPVAAAEAQLTRLAAALRPSPVETAVRTGAAAEEIRTAIVERAAPVLVLCSQTRTGLDRLLYGSITGELVRSATCSVLVVRGTPPATPADAVPLHTVVVPLDQSSLAEHALPHALAALGPADLHLHLLHVLEPPSAAVLVASTRDEATIRHSLEATAQPLRSQGYDVTTEVRSGTPAEEIARVAGEQGAHLIALATHGWGGVRPTLLGSVAERLLRMAPVPLLFVHPADSTGIA